MDNECSLEAPRRPRSEAQIAAPEITRAKRAVNYPAHLRWLSPYLRRSPQLSPSPHLLRRHLEPPQSLEMSRRTKVRRKSYIVREERQAEKDELPRDCYANFAIV